MSSISLFPCSFTPVETVIRELSNRLDLRLYSDADLIADTSAQYGTGPEKLKKMMYGRTSVFNQFTLERELCVNSFRSVLADKLEGYGTWFFHGQLSSLIPRRVTHVLKVIVVDRKQARVNRGVEQGLSVREAKKAVHVHDLEAYNWTDFLFQKEAYDSSLYDLVIPAEARSENEVVKEIVDVFRRTSVLHTAESQQAVADMQLENRVERLLLQNGHKLKVRANRGRVTLTAQNTVLSFTKLSRELSMLARRVEGVVDVKVEKNPAYTESIYRRQNFELPSKVLFVDDEKEFVRTVSDRLISRDVGTYGVYNGEEALEMVIEDRPDVMVLDLKMPGLHGVEVLRRTKEIAPEVEVIILTGHGTSRDMQDCMELGAFAYLNKPVDIEELSATIKAANERAHLKVA